MTEALETAQVGPYTVKVYQDEDPISPRELGCNATIIAVAHPRFCLGDVEPSQYYSHAAREVTLDKYHVVCDADGVPAMWPIEVLENWQPQLRIARRFDEEYIDGWIFLTKETVEETGVREEHFEEAVKGDLEDYNQYLRGEQYGFTVEESKVCNLGHTHTEVLESCWGFYSIEEALDEGKAIAENIRSHN